MEDRVIADIFASKKVSSTLKARSLFGIDAKKTSTVSICVGGRSPSFAVLVWLGQAVHFDERRTRRVA